VHVVTLDEYEQSKSHLEEQRRAGAELIETAYQAQLRALDLVWMLQGGEAGAGRATALFSSGPTATTPTKQESPAPHRTRRRRAPEVDADVRAAFPRLPVSFTRHNVVEALGYEPDRGALYRSLGKLVETGRARVESSGFGQRATVYRKTGDDESPTPS
jgi:hypothetical protein